MYITIHMFSISKFVSYNFYLVGNMEFTVETSVLVILRHSDSNASGYLSYVILSDIIIMTMETKGRCRKGNFNISIINKAYSGQYVLRSTKNKV